MNTADQLTFKIAAFAALVEADQNRRAIENGLGSNLTETERKAVFRLSTTVKPGLKYTKVDIGDGGRFMVELATGNIYGIKAYGQVHKGHFYGTLDTMHDWCWGGYYPERKAAPLPKQGSSSIPKLTRAPEATGTSLHAPTGQPARAATIVALPDPQVLGRTQDVKKLAEAGVFSDRVTSVSSGECMKWAETQIAEGIESWWILAKANGTTATDFNNTVEGYVRKAIIGALTN